MIKNLIEALAIGAAVAVGSITLLAILVGISSVAFEVIRHV